MSLILAKELSTESQGMVSDVIGAELTRIPGHIHKHRDRIFHRLEVADIKNPHAVEAIIGCESQLLPHILGRCNIQPLRVARSAHIVNMIIETPATRMPTFLSIWHTTEVTPVIVAEQYQHIVRHTHTLVVIIEHLFIQSPYLRSLICWFACNLFNYLSLVFNDSLKQFGICILTHRLVAITTHTYSNDIISALHPLDTLTEESVEVFLVLLIVPGAPLFSIAGILLVIPCHRLMMGCSDDDAHSVGCLQILRVVGIESPSPHGRPKEISLQSEYKLEYLRIETMIAILCAEGVLHPRGQTRGLIVEEDTTIAHIRLTICIFAWEYIYILMLHYRHISPVIPRRHTHLL